ncbi:MAG: FAD:protein FMN transferase [Bacteroidota bacterium]|nr:FAD:protein FMN transferase [Bacteroidota bacterium]MDP4211749.1 FAD:protein FMN transferase [Bacteroidota bacterium]MDP4251663.1 FAD:protein FMN transferase [Bacteroidota bacterium]
MSKTVRIKGYLFISLLLFVVQAGRGQKRYVFEQAEMGSPFTITLYCNDSASAASSADAAFKKAEELNGLLNDYNDSSEINRLSLTSGQNRYVPVSDALFDILRRGVEAARLSGGAYDVSIGPLVKLWRDARKTKIFPNRDSLRTALQKTGYRYIRLDSGTHSVMLEKKGMKLDVGGLGKGFVAAAALEVLNQNGIYCAMVNAGGKIVTGRPPPGKAGWLIGINAPGEKQEILPLLLQLKCIAVATSGDLYQYVEINGKRYSHIVDPATGIGLTRRKNVTAIATDATTADWLATACSILSTGKSLKLIRRIPGAALLITERRKGRIRERSSANFKNYLDKTL